VLLYRNENDKVMYEMIDKCVICGTLVDIEDLNFIILHFKVSSLPFLWYVVCFIFKFSMVVSYIWAKNLASIEISPWVDEAHDPLFFIHVLLLFCIVNVKPYKEVYILNYFWIWYVYIIFFNYLHTQTA